MEGINMLHPPFLHISALLILLALPGCTRIGQISIESERNEYNDVIRSTASEQLLGNIVRASFFETPSFFDVIEVDHAKSLQGNVQGGSANIGAILGLGSLTSTLSATDSPILKYQPPSSAAFIAQTLNPIPLSSLAKFVNSNANLVPLLAFTINRWTPRFNEYDEAIDLVDALDEYGAIDFETRSDGKLALMRRPDGLLTRKAALATNDKSLNCLPANGSALVSSLWLRLSAALGQVGAAPIILKSPEAKAQGSVVLTRTALGSLRTAEVHDVAFLDAAEASKVVERNKNATCFNREYYYLDDEINGRQLEEEWESRFDLLKNHGAADDFRIIGHWRALMIIGVTDLKPSSAYVTIKRGTKWYSIDEADAVSKMNFSLLGNILIVQAQVPQQPPTQTVINAVR